jgi:superkiller protein 3
VRAVEAYQRLRTLRSHDVSLVMKENFCRGLAQIARGQFHEAVKNLRASLAIDPNFACAYNALGVALTRLQQPAEARAAFEHAIRLAPQWSLPFLQLGQLHVAGGNLAGAVPYLEKAARFNPQSMQIRWTLARAYRLSGRASDFERQAKEMIQADPNYAPTYLELGTHYEAHRQYALASQAFDTYVLLAPNYGDSAQVRARAERSRGLAARRHPTLLRQ